MPRREDEPARAPGNGRIRVVLGARDRRFLRVTSFLLTREGFSVECCSQKLSDLLRRVERHRADVVVLDATGSLKAAARVIAALEVLSPPVGVLVVADDSDTSLTDLEVLPKWSSFDRLVAEIEHAYKRHERGQASYGLL